MSAHPYDTKALEKLSELSCELEFSQDLAETKDLSSYDTHAREKCRYEHDHSIEQLRMMETQLRKNKA